MVCGKVCSSKEALDHKNETGHDLWELLKEDKMIEKPDVLSDDSEIVKNLEKQYGFTWVQLIGEAIDTEIVDRGNAEQFLLDIIWENRKAQRDKDYKKMLEQFEELMDEEEIADVILNDGEYTARGSMLLAREIIKALQFQLKEIK